MSKTIDYYLSPLSPWAFLGSRRLAEIAERQRAQVAVKPVSFNTVFAETGGLPLAKRSAQRQAYRLQELKRWRKRLEIPINLHPAYFPAPDGLACRFILAAGMIGGDPLRLAEAIGRAVWIEERNIADTGTLQDIAEESGHHRITILAKAIEPTLETQVQDLTREAVARGVFGAPTYAVGEHLLWGQDRLIFLEELLSA
ncbi:MAG: 2-hydroxychromene-2-carboxylate isomerase [Kiloniellales bacterium]